MDERKILSILRNLTGAVKGLRDNLVLLDMEVSELRKRVVEDRLEVNEVAAQKLRAEEIEATRIKAGAIDNRTVWGALIASVAALVTAVATWIVKGI